MMTEVMKMKVNILASGSSGNCIAIQSESTCILIDAGVPKTKIEKRLLEVGIRADEINAIFVTHGHKDHTKGLTIANKYRIPVYAAEGEWKSIEGVDEDIKNSIVDQEPITNIGAFDIFPFRTQHDAYHSLGYVVDDYANQKSCSICLDTGVISEEMLKEMNDSEIFIIEANHDPEMVEASDYPDSVKARILSDVGHLSNEQTAEALSKLVKGKGEQIYLTHLSSNNNLPILAELTVRATLGLKGYKAGIDYKIEVI